MQWTRRSCSLTEGFRSGLKSPETAFELVHNGRHRLGVTHHRCTVGCQYNPTAWRRLAAHRPVSDRNGREHTTHAWADQSRGRELLGRQWWRSVEGDLSAVTQGDAWLFLAVDGAVHSAQCLDRALANTGGYRRLHERNLHESINGGSLMASNAWFHQRSLYIFLRTSLRHTTYVLALAEITTQICYNWAQLTLAQGDKLSVSHDGRTRFDLMIGIAFITIVNLFANF